MGSVINDPYFDTGMSKQIIISYKVALFEELSEEDQALVTAARNAKSGAHAPYSNFQVGSAVRMEDGSVVIGNNQENAAYPSGLCAERVALFAAKSQSKGPINSIAIVAQNEKDKSADAYSCGNCRQVMLEYAGQQDQPIRVMMGSADGSFIVISDVRHLMPFSFDSKTLG